MYKKSLILFFTIVCFNTSFGNSNGSDSKAKFALESAIDAELFKKLENVDPAQAAHYLTLQQELNQNHRNEKRMSKPELFGITGVTSALGAGMTAFISNEKARETILAVFCLGLTGSLVGIGFTSNAPLYTDKNSEILEKMNAINLTPIKK
jgi:hypothetical protein